MLGASILSALYNRGIGHFPSRHIRDWCLSTWLGGYGRGAGVQIGCWILNGRRIYIGERSVVNFGCLLDGRKFDIRIGSDVSIGPRATILSLGHDPQSPTFSDRGAPVEISDHVWIGYGAVVLPGIKIGKGAVVGAGAVVTRDVDAYSIVAGNPAKVIGSRTSDLNYSLNFRPFLL